MGSAIQPIQGENFREAALRMIRTGIVTGEIEPGEIYSARTLAERLGVSATPVREAMLDLASEGLVTPLKNRGFQVVGLSEHDLDEIFEVRVMLEVPATVKATKLLESRDIKALRALAEKTVVDAKRGNLQAFLDHDMDFHMRIVSKLENRRLTDLVKRLRDQARLVGLRRLAESGQLTATAAEHPALVDALEAADERRVRSLIEQHLRHTRGVWAGRDEKGSSGTR